MRIKLTSLVFAAAWLALLCATPVRLRAATLTVTNIADSGPGSLRAALAGAANGDTIDATGVSGTITLTTGELTVSNSVTLFGPGAGTLTVSGNNASRVFDVTGTNVTICWLTIANGQGALYGAGIRTSGGAGSVVTLGNCVVTNNTTTLLGAGIFNSLGVTLTLSNCTISGNSAPSGNAGGIYNSNATLTVIASTLSGNFAYYVGGGIMNDGSGDSATLTITASTLSGNSAYSAGGILNYGQSGSATLTISASTLSGNWAYADGGGAIYNNGWYGNGTVMINASTLSSNSAAYGGAILSDGYEGVAVVQIGDTILNGGGQGANIYNGSGTVTSAGYNLSSDDGGGFLTATGDQTNTAPLLGPLQDNGGPTWTHALLTNSPAIDQGKSNAIPTLARATDQRGAPRISDFPAVPNAADGSDIGAFELQYIPPAQSTPTGAYTFTTFAGKARTGSDDGVGDQAQFNSPFDIAADSAGNLYVADTDNNTIRKITPAGVVSTIAGVAGFAGSADGMGSNARFNGPMSIAVDTAGNLYVADTWNCTIRKVTPVGTNWVVSTIAGVAGVEGSADATGSNARFCEPFGITLGGDGNLYVADSLNCTIRKMTPVGTNWVVSTIAGQAGNWGSADGTDGSASFSQPEGIVMDGNGNLFVTDTDNDTVRKMTPVGTNWVVTTIAGWAGSYGSTDGTGSSARFYLPMGITLDSAGNLYVADYFNQTIRKIMPAGNNWVVSTFAGLAGSSGDSDGTGSDARFFYPRGVTVDSTGILYVADTENCAIREITSAGVVGTLAGVAGASSGADGTGGNARFKQPYGITLNSAGYLYVADTGNDTIRKITSAGVVNTLAGLAGSTGSADGAGDRARFNNPLGIVVDSAGNLYVTDELNNTIRKVTPAGVVSTIAGLAGSFGTNDGANNSARFDYPSGVTVDSTGDLYVSDMLNLTIRKITPVGTNWVVSTIAGSGWGSADGTNRNSQFVYPFGITVDSAGNLFVADAGNRTIRKMTPVGTNWVVSTIAGLAGGIGSADGTGTNAQFYYPCGIAVDGAGNLYVTDAQNNNTVRRITPVGTNWVVTTLAGLAGTSGSADGTGSAAMFNWPAGIAVDNAGIVYVADSFNNEIRKGVFMAYGAANAVAYSPPAMTGALVVFLQPTNASGQWQFPWDQFWRNSGDVVSNLVPGNYPLVFRDVSGYLAYPSTISVAVFTNATTCVTNQYLPTLAPGASGTGSLMVDIGPNQPTGAGWRFIGETVWRAAYMNVSGLLPDTYYVEFAPVSGWSRPASLAAQVFGGQQSVVTANYTLAQSPPNGVLLPHPVPTNNLSDLADYPFGFNGQLLTDVGYGSGVAVSTNVVLTAAHLVFNDFTLAYADHAYWYFQREAGVFEPEPLAARGWYLLSGYAAQRTNDLLGGLSPDQSSPQSRNLDVAALYFNLPCAGGGSGGYLPSDVVPNTWLTSTSLKMLVGYPVDGSELGDASIVPGQMYQTDPQPYALSLATDPVPGQQEVYVAPWFLSYPGNSGGPVYVQMNGYYYPAGVYLGTLYSGAQPYASLVRAIDSAVVNLITNAVMLGDAGTNNTGGGVITLIAGSASTSHPAYVQVVLGPPAAVSAGAGWRLQGDATYGTATNYTRSVTSSNAVIEFAPVSGWNLPTNQSVSLTAGQLTVINANYTLTPPVMVLNKANGLGISGAAGTTYRIEYRTNLTQGAWLPLETNTIGSGTNYILPWSPTNSGTRFYRAVWLGR